MNILNKKILIGLVLLTAFFFTSFGFHKFYMAIYQINYVAAKKRIEITARLFTDDLNVVLEKKYHKKTAIGLMNETAEDEILLKKYIAEHIIFNVNNTKKTIQFMSKEIESNVVVCYFKISEVSKINTFEIQNDVFTEQFSEQQNLIQSTIYGEKKSILLSNDLKTAKIK